MPTIQLGNAAPREGTGPAVTYINVPSADEGYSVVGVGDDDYPTDLAAALKNAKGKARRMLIDGWLANRDGVHGIPNHEAFVAIVDPNGLWAKHSEADPTWVWSDNEALAAQLADYFGCPVGPPGDLEATHHTRAGGPGTFPDPLGGMTMLKTNAGNDIQSQQMGGGLVGETGTASASSATSLTTNSGRTATLNDLAGQVVVAWSNGAYGLITGNTAGTNTVLTVDRWYTPATPGGAAATTPGSTTGYTIMPGATPSWYMGLTANSSAPAAGDTTLTGEITTAGGGLIRKICAYAHTASAASYTLTAVFTANGTDSLPVTVAKVGVSQSITAGVRQQFQTLLTPSTATFSASGDQVTATSTVTI